MIVTISDHAIERYVERVGGDRVGACAALSCPLIGRAADFGVRVIRIGQYRVILAFNPEGATVVTVLPVDRLPRQLMPVALGGPHPVCRDPFFQQHKDRSHSA